MSMGNMENIRIQGLLDSYLRVRTNKIEAQGQHLDDDLLSAFVEGRLSETELKPITTHLIDCGFCRNVTSELVRLELAFADDTIVSRTEAPTKVSEVMNGFFAKLFGSSIGEVFAHQESEEEEEKAETGNEEEEK
jgi:hypothetical protein